MRITVAALLALFAACAVADAQPTRPTTAPATAPVAAPPQADRRGSDKRALIVSIDGLRPDVALRADMPTLRSLMARGSYSFWARTTEVSITLPSHTSMVTGVTPNRHKITWNGDIPASQLFYPLYPTIFELATDAGYTTGLVAGKSKFVALQKPHTLDWADVPPAKGSNSDADVARLAVWMIRDHQPQVLMVHFPGADGAGHGKGWGTPDQVAAIEKIDAGLGTIIAELERQKLFDKTLIIVSADHGGAGKSHGKDDPRSRHIPWVVTGPGVRRDFDLTFFKDLVINTEDTFATACDFLGLTYPSDIDGKPIMQIYEGADLLQPVPPTTRPATAPAPVSAKSAGTQPAAALERGFSSEGYQNPYPESAAIGAGFKTNNSISAEFAVASDICPGTVETAAAATQPSAPPSVATNAGEGR
jgi:hypothetical protein